MLVSWILRLLLLILLVRALWRLIAGVLEGVSVPQTPDRPAKALVRDPVCGTFVLPSKALSAGDGASVQYFCSERCRERYRAR
jgi:YHS domain-containing protein